MAVTITEAEAERIIDGLVLRALSTSLDYNNAESAEEQSAVEEAISERVTRRVYFKFRVI